MAITDAEARHWRDRLLAAPDDDTRGSLLKELRSLDRGSFLSLCRDLAGQPPLEVQQLGLRQLGYYDDPDDRRADEIARAQLENPVLVDAALLALGTVALPRTFPILVAVAAEGNDVGLRSATNQARTPEQRRQVLLLARQQIMSTDFQMRVQAVWALRRLSMVEEEEQLLIEAARQFPDELISGALRHATPCVLPALRQMRRKYRAASAQYLDIMNAIQAIQARDQRASE